MNCSYVHMDSRSLLPDPSSVRTASFFSCAATGKREWVRDAVPKKVARVGPRTTGSWALLLPSVPLASSLMLKRIPRPSSSLIRLASFTRGMVLSSRSSSSVRSLPRAARVRGEPEGKGRGNVSPLAPLSARTAPPAAS